MKNTFPPILKRYTILSVFEFSSPIANERRGNRLANKRSCHGFNGSRIFIRIWFLADQLGGGLLLLLLSYCFDTRAPQINSYLEPYYIFIGRTTWRLISIEIRLIDDPRSNHRLPLVGYSFVRILVIGATFLYRLSRSDKIWNEIDLTIDIIQFITPLILTSKIKNRQRILLSFAIV